MTFTNNNYILARKQKLKRTIKQVEQPSPATLTHFYEMPRKIYKL